MKKAISKEDEVIGNLKSQFNRPTLHGQRRIAISPAIANGNIALAYHRGLAEGQKESDKETALNKKLKEALIILIRVTRHSRNVGFQVRIEDLRSEAVQSEMELERIFGKKELERFNKKAFK